MSFEQIRLGTHLRDRGYIRGPFGSALKRGELLTAGIPVYEQQHAIDGTRSFRFFIDQTKYQELKRFSVQSDDLIVSCSGTVGRVSIVRDDDPKGIISQALLILRPDLSRLSSRYLYYFLTSPSGQSALIQASHGAVQQNIAPRAVVERIQLPLPAIEEQYQIVEMLSSLDARITLLRETNVTLEAIAQALFKSWFVDFDPVRAKMEGRAPEGMDEATAALFPQGFVESALGSIPKGWSPCAVYDLATYINGAAYKVFEPNSERLGRPIIKIAELKAGVTSQTAYSAVDMHAKYLIEAGDILFSWSGNPDTSIDTFVWTHESGWLNQHIFRVLPQAEHERAFLLQLLRHLRPTFAELARNKQTTGLGHVTVADLKRLLIVKADEEILKTFNSAVGQIQAKIFFNERQAQILTALRDTLLPRLISGQLRLPDAEALIEEVAA